MLNMIVLAPNAQREREHRGHGEAGAPEKLADTIAQVAPKPLDHSDLSATSGSTRPARCAGMAHATTGRSSRSGGGGGGGGCCLLRR